MNCQVFFTWITGLALAAGTLPAQTAMKGKYALVERGVLSNGLEFVALGTLTVDAAGRVTGGEYVRGAGASAEVTYGGSYNAADGALALTYMATNGEGDETAVPVNLRVVASGTALHVIRTDLGVVSQGELIPIEAAGAALKGSYLLNETTVGSTSVSFVSLTTLTLDGGQARGRTTRKSFGPATTFDLTGTYSAGADGAGTLTLQSPVVNEEGETTYVPASYRFIAIDGKQLVAVRADAGTVTMVEVSAVQ